jgi:hypothetical protein
MEGIKILLSNSEYDSSASEQTIEVGEAIFESNLCTF